jgi:hypothetical protein
METILLIAVGFFGGFFVETKADVVEAKLGKTFTLEYKTTKWFYDNFDFAFERTAEKLCPHGYTIIDRTNQEKDVKSTYTKWLIVCKDKDGKDDYQY